jgi:hypothetical protein
MSIPFFPKCHVSKGCDSEQCSITTVTEFDSNRIFHYLRASVFKSCVTTIAEGFGGQGKNALVVAWYSRYASPRLFNACCSVSGIPVALSKKNNIPSGPMIVSQPNGTVIASNT